MTPMLVSVVCIAACSAAWAQIEVGPTGVGPVDVEQIRKLMTDRLNLLLGAQHADGSWELTQPAALRDFKVGATALCVLALEHCYPHLEKDLAVRTHEAIEKGVAYVNSSPFECRTYSAALAISALYRHDPAAHRGKIATYADMLCRSQSPSGRFAGMWGYVLLPAKNAPSSAVVTGTIPEWGDNSNTQMAILGLYQAYRAGISIPQNLLRNTQQHYIKTQNDDGGWGYKDDYSPLSYESMTVAGVITLNLTDELLHAPTSAPCQPMPRDEAIEKGFKWLDGNLNYKFLDLYGLYTVERLGILMGQRELHGKDWFTIGAGLLVGAKEWPVKLVQEKNSVAGTAFGLLFLSRGLEPVIMFKLKRKGSDWDNNHYAVKHLTEYISDRFQKPRQWRVVDLDAPQNVLNSVPILHINGKLALNFNDQERLKLADYVTSGGTILAESCVGATEFDASFRELMKKLFPEGSLEPLPDDHVVFHTPRELNRKLVVEVLKIGKGDDERCAVFYLPQGICSSWHRWAATDQWAFDFGANLFFCVDKRWKKGTPAPQDKAPQEKKD